MPPETRAPLALACLAAALAAAPAAGQQSSRDAGLVVLLGERATAAGVPELMQAEGPAILLTPYPNPACELLSGRLLGRAASCHFVRPGDTERSNERALAEAVRGAGLIGLWGGDQHDWFDVFWPHGDRSRLLAALREAQRGGATVVGQGAAGAFLSAASVWDFSLPADPPVRRPAAPPHDLDEPVLAWCLGLQPWAAIDTEARSGGSAWDLIDLLVAERLRLGVYLEGEAALVYDPAAPELRARGSGAVWLFDLRNARSGKRRISGARFSLLTNGDAWSRRTREVASPAECKSAPVESYPIYFARGPLLQTTPVETSGWTAHESRGACGWSRFAGFVIDGSRLRPVQVLEATRGGNRAARGTLTPDEDSAVCVHASGRIALSSLRLDLEWDL